MALHLIFHTFFTVYLLSVVLYLIKGITPKIRKLCFILINGFILNLFICLDLAEITFRFLPETTFFAWTSFTVSWTTSRSHSRKPTASSLFCVSPFSREVFKWNRFCAVLFYNEVVAYFTCSNKLNACRLMFTSDVTNINGLKSE